MATATAAASLLFAIGTGLSSRPWPVDWIADELVDDQWTVPCTLVVATLTATYAWWIHGQLRGRPEHDLRSWRTGFVATIIASTVVLGTFWMLEEYASEVGRRYALLLAANVEDLRQATVTSPTPLGIRADGVVEEVVREMGSTYYRTTGLRLLARSGGKVLLLPTEWTLEAGTVIVIADRDDLVWQFSR